MHRPTATSRLPPDRDVADAHDLDPLGAHQISTDGHLDREFLVHIRATELTSKGPRMLSL